MKLFYYVYTTVGVLSTPHPSIFISVYVVYIFLRQYRRKMNFKSDNGRNNIVLRVRKRLVGC